MIPWRPASEARDPLRLGKYDLLGRIGFGGMAEVWLARQHGPMGFEKLVAIKRLLPHLQDQDPFVRMFLDEARIAARINHANVVQIYDLGQADESYFIAMEYLLGESLARVMGEGVKRGHPLPDLLSIAVVAQMCKGLHHAHALRDAKGLPLAIVHRDVSPQNVVLLYDGAVKLLDFGIAKARERLSEATTTGMKGKYAYMSPEQCVGDPVDHRSDIFAAGVVLWELLTRRRLFKHPNKLMVLKMITEGHVAEPTRVNPEAPPELDPICLRALAKNPSERYQTANELADDLEGVLAKRGLSGAPNKLSEYLGDVFADDLERRNQFAAIITEDEAPRETAEHWLDLLPEPTGEVISFTRSPAVATSGGKPPLARSSSRWWIATAVFALLAATATLAVVLLTGRGGSESRLMIESTPSGAALSLDGAAPSRTTPAVLEHLKVGKHQIELQLAGHKPWSRAVELRAGETLRLEAELQKVSVAVPATQPVVASRPAPDRGAAVAPPPQSGFDLGQLNLQTQPWATIYYGRRRLGDTPLIGVHLPVGTLTLTAVNPEEKIRTTFKVEIKRGQVVRKVVKLR
jgi:eukaryotic-like serine/threonine-protein kinase